VRLASVNANAEFNQIQNAELKVQSGKSEGREARKRGQGVYGSRGEEKPRTGNCIFDTGEIRTRFYILP
jgi:hypothetical protein